MNEGYWALLVCILRPVLPEQAFHLLQTGKLSKELQKQTGAEMAAMAKSGLNYTKIAEIYNVNRSSAFNAVKRYNNRAVS